jgi:hypothetical protein
MKGGSATEIKTVWERYLLTIEIALKPIEKFPKRRGIFNSVRCKFLYLR